MRYSKQREIILDYLKSVTIHPTAEQVYNSVKEKQPNISLGTVYRNLDRLSEEKEILRIEVANKKDRFDYNTNHHYHAICIECEEVSDIFVDYFNNIDRLVEKDSNLVVISHDIIFNTICSECNKKLKEEI